MADKIKFLFALCLLAAGLFGFYFLADQAMIFRVLSVVLGAALAVLLAWRTLAGRRFMVFVREAWLETRKVVWPTRKETIQMTWAVFAFVVLMALFLYLADKSLEWVLYDLILGWK